MRTRCPSPDKARQPPQRPAQAEAQHVAARGHVRQRTSLRPSRGPRALQRRVCRYINLGGGRISRPRPRPMEAAGASRGTYGTRHAARRHACRTASERTRRRKRTRRKRQRQRNRAHNSSQQERAGVRSNGARKVWGSSVVRAASECCHTRVPCGGWPGATVPHLVAPCSRHRPAPTPASMHAMHAMLIGLALFSASRAPSQVRAFGSRIARTARARATPGPRPSDPEDYGWPKRARCTAAAHRSSARYIRRQWTQRQ